MKPFMSSTAFISNKPSSSINVAMSGTRKEELLYHPDEFTKVAVLRRALTDVPAVEAMELLLSKMRATPNNIAFLMALDLK